MFYRASQSYFAEAVGMEIFNHRMCSAKCCHIAIGSAWLSRRLNTKGDSNNTVPHVVPVTSGGIVYYLNSSSGPNLVGGAMPISVSSTSRMTVGGPEVVRAVSIETPRTEPTTFTLQDLAQLLASSRKYHLSEWKLAKYNGDPLQWHEWFDQFKSAIDSARLTDDVKLTYLKTLTTGKTKVAIAHSAYCRTMYKDALNTWKRKFGRQ